MLIPGGAIGVLLKSKEPCMCACAESLGLTRLALSRFRVRSAWGISLSHRFIGKLGGVEQRPALKWFLNV